MPQQLRLQVSHSVDTEIFGNASSGFYQKQERGMDSKELWGQAKEFPGREFWGARLLRINSW